ncbi:hypothetical protein [Blastococcus atacamensis]|uniref:hypothetical protein n=1 Tax=Blastococcus atacamensis TaxID=2070508 RepID=UPI000CECCBA6|nr:hypothetical protein [Blastococcus atacamensis]
MTEPSVQRPVPGPPRPGPSPTPAPVHGAASVSGAAQGQEPRIARDERADVVSDAASATRITGLEGVPVAEHVAVFEAEHERLRRELGTIDAL